MITPLNNYTRLHSTNQVHASHNSTTHSTLWLVSQPKYRDVHVIIWYCSNAANRVCSVVLGFPWVLRLWQGSLWKLLRLIWKQNASAIFYNVTLLIESRWQWLKTTKRWVSPQWLYNLTWSEAFQNGLIMSPAGSSSLLSRNLFCPSYWKREGFRRVLSA